MFLKLGGLVAVLGVVATSAYAEEAAPAPRLVELTDDEAKMASTLLSFACKASPGEDLAACDAASLLRKKIASAPRAPAKPAAGSGTAPASE